MFTRVYVDKKIGFPFDNIMLIMQILMITTVVYKTFLTSSPHSETLSLATCLTAT